MQLLSYAYKFLSNFVFLALVYLALNFLEKYQHRVVVAILVLVYAGMHAASALRSFHFFQPFDALKEVERPQCGCRMHAGIDQHQNSDDHAVLVLFEEIEREIDQGQEHEVGSRIYRRSSVTASRCSGGRVKI